MTSTPFKDDNLNQYAIPVDDRRIYLGDKDGRIFIAVGDLFLEEKTGQVFKEENGKLVKVN